MQLGARGLVEVATSDLEKILRGLHRGELACPFTIAGLTCVGLQHAAEKLEHLRGLPEPAVRAVVIAVIAERREAARRASRA